MYILTIIFIIILTSKNTVLFLFLLQKVGFIDYRSYAGISLIGTLVDFDNPNAGIKKNTILLHHPI